MQFKSLSSAGNVCLFNGFSPCAPCDPHRSRLRGDVTSLSSICIFLGDDLLVLFVPGTLWVGVASPIQPLTSP